MDASYFELSNFISLILRHSNLRDLKQWKGVHQWHTNILISQEASGFDRYDGPGPRQ